MFKIYGIVYLKINIKVLMAISEKEYDRLSKILEKYEDQLFNYHGVVSIGIGKIINGNIIKPCIDIYIQDSFYSTNKIPTILENIPTNIIVSGRIKPL
jgi:hypothetical protein